MGQEKNSLGGNRGTEKHSTSKKKGRPTLGKGGEGQGDIRTSAACKNRMASYRIESGGVLWGYLSMKSKGKKSGDVLCHDLRLDGKRKTYWQGNCKEDQVKLKFPPWKQANCRGKNHLYRKKSSKERKKKKRKKKNTATFRRRCAIKWLSKKDRAHNLIKAQTQKRFRSPLAESTYNRFSTSCSFLSLNKKKMGGRDYDKTGSARRWGRQIWAPREGNSHQVSAKVAL